MRQLDREINIIQTICHRELNDCVYFKGKLFIQIPIQQTFLPISQHITNRIKNEGASFSQVEAAYERIKMKCPHCDGSGEQTTTDKVFQAGIKLSSTYSDYSCYVNGLDRFGHNMICMNVTDNLANIKHTLWIELRVLYMTSEIRNEVHNVLYNNLRINVYNNITTSLENMIGFRSPFGFKIEKLNLSLHNYESAYNGLIGD